MPLARGLGHSLAAAKFLELAQRATFAMLLVDLAARRVRSGADAAGPITVSGVRRDRPADRTTGLSLVAWSFFIGCETRTLRLRENPVA
jgi:hypothetical protein